MKKNVIVIVIGILFVILFGVAFFFFSEKNKPDSSLVNVSENGVQFKYPKNLIHQSHGPTVSTSHYAVHTITSFNGDSTNKSEIQILIPLAEAPGETGPLSGRLKDFTKEVIDTPPQIEHLSINGHDAEKLVIDTSKLKGNSLADGQKNDVMTTIELMSKYPNSYIALSYIRYDGDSSLDQAWQTIVSSLNY